MSRRLSVLGRSINKLRGPKNRHSLVRTLAQQAARRPALIYTLESQKMDQPRKFRLVLSIMLCFILQAQGADKYTDENRPYEFGFKIDGQQHRHESKDKDGIIMGEFGFVTADDVYHVTVYATDKEGRFKILSMKNIHLKSTPASSPGLPTSPRQGHALSLPPAQPASVQAPTALQTAPTPHSSPAQPFQSLEPPGRSCSSCSLPPTTTKAPPTAYNQVNGNNNYNSPSAFAPGSNPQNQETFPPSPTGLQPNVQSRLGGSSYRPQGVQPGNPQGGQPGNNLQGDQPGNPQQGPSVSQNYPQEASGVTSAGSTFGQQPGPSPQNYPSAPNYARGPGNSGSNSGGNSPYIGSEPSRPDISQDRPSGPNSPLPGEASYPQEGIGGRTSKQYTGPEQQFYSNGGPNSPQSPGSAPGGQSGSTKPTLVSAQMQIVDKNTDIHALRPGEKEGLPPGLTKDDMTQLLYTFNYTVGFHGHFEEGYTNGAKKGYYYVTGRNGVRTRIDYVADDTGFHPKVSQDVLDLLSDDVPKPETEKDAKFGLKGYEFKWLYYPVESKRP